MLEKLLDQLLDYLPNIIYALIMFAVGFLVIKLVTRFLRAAFSRTKLDKTGWSFLISVIKAALYVILAVMILSQLKVPMSSIVAALGTAGLAIGLALRDSLSNVAGGFILMFSRPFKVGDYIEIGGKEGNVASISIVSTKLLTLDNKAVIIPNSIMTSKTITNFTQEDHRRLELRFNISYNDDFEQARQTLLETVKANPLTLDKPQLPYIRMSRHDHHSVEMLLRVWVRTEDYWEAYYGLLEQVKTSFDGADITIPYEQLEVHLVNEDG
ncbi:MAG: mechanosensitive ion channel family protein [Ruminococcus sp.]|nr:mechanosensitive ion channel family protein [Ruminococcus sp.]